MNLTIEQWEKILDSVNLNENEVDILEQIKGNLQDRFRPIHKNWETEGFNISHLFNIELIINDKQYRENFTLLSIAAKSGKLDIVKYLKEQGADVNLKNNNGFTALHLAAWKGKLDIVKYLKEQGANVDEKDADGWTPLYFAARSGKLDIVKYLIEQEADVNLQDNDGFTALHLAAQNGKLDIVKYLKEQGADITLKNNNGFTALHLASQSNQESIFLYLFDEAGKIFKEELAKLDLDHLFIKAPRDKGISSKAVKAGGICGAIAALAVGGGLFAAGVELPILALIGIAVAAALVIGVIAGGITYLVSKPSDKLDEPDLGAKQQVNGVC